MKIQRRHFLKASLLAGLIPLGHTTAVQAAVKQRDYYELRKYLLKTALQKEGLNNFMAKAAIPALNRININPVGVFDPTEDADSAYVLLRHKSAESLVTATEKLLADEKFLKDGSAFLDSSAESPAYERIESSLMIAFEGMPQLEIPVTDASRIFQLRIYESPSLKTGQKKIEMFNSAELEIFRKTGLHAVFFGETIIGSKIPNLTYMLSFKNMQESKENWQAFIADLEWKELSSRPEYADKKILSNITNIFLRPADCSQI
jgi:hypothetical protein